VHIGLTFFKVILIYFFVFLCRNRKYHYWNPCWGNHVVQNCTWNHNRLHLCNLDTHHSSLLEVRKIAIWTFKKVALNTFLVILSNHYDQALIRRLSKNEQYLLSNAYYPLKMSRKKLLFWVHIAWDRILFGTKNGDDISLTFTCALLSKHNVSFLALHRCYRKPKSSQIELDSLSTNNRLSAFGSLNQGGAIISRTGTMLSNHSVHSANSRAVSTYSGQVSKTTWLSELNFQYSLTDLSRPLEKKFCFC